MIGEDFNPDAMGESLFEYLNKQRDIEVGGSEFSLRATVPNPVIAGMLGMDIGLPLLMIEDLYLSLIHISCHCLTLFPIRLNRRLCAELGEGPT